MNDSDIPSFDISTQAKTESDKIYEAQLRLADEMDGHLHHDNWVYSTLLLKGGNELTFREYRVFQYLLLMTLGFRKSISDEIAMSTIALKTCMRKDHVGIAIKGLLGKGWIIERERCTNKQAARYEISMVQRALGRRISEVDQPDQSRGPDLGIWRPRIGELEAPNWGARGPKSGPIKESPKEKIKESSKARAREPDLNKSPGDGTAQARAYLAAKPNGLMRATMELIIKRQMAQAGSQSMENHFEGDSRGPQPETA